MPIIIRLDRVLADRKMQMNDLAEKVGISNVNMSNLKTGKVKAIRFSTLEAICKYLNCQPGDILEYNPDFSNLTFELLYFLRIMNLMKWIKVIN